MKKFFVGIFIVALLLATFATLPRVDYVEPNVLFYFQHLTPLYYVCVLAAIVVAIYWRRSYLGLLSVIVLSLLILLTPSIMLVQPWFLDTYPFVSEAVYVVRNGHLGDFHYLSENSALGLTFGPFLMITGISPLLLIKIYPGLVAVIFTVLLYLTAEKMKIGKESLVVAPLLFISIAWPNELHLCRQSFSLIYYLTSWFLLLRLIFQGQDRRIFVLLVTQIVLLTISHPATPLFFMANLATIAIIGWVLGKFRLKEFTWARERLLPQTLLISALSWILWNSFLPTGAIRSLTDISRNLIASILGSPFNVSGVAKIFAKFTTIYSLVVNMRLALTLAVVISAVLLPVLMYRYLRDRKVLVILMGWIISNVLSSIPLLYAGLPYFARPVLFAFISWAPLGALVHNTLVTKRKSGVHLKMKSIARCILLVAFIVLPALLMPIIKYGPVPFLYPTSKELYNKRFLDLHWNDSGNLICLEYNFPYSYSYILDGHQEPKFLNMWDVYHLDEGLDPRINSASLWIISRLCVRDAFWAHSPSMLQLVENITQILPETTHNKVYDSGWPEWILVPRSNST